MDSFIVGLMVGAIAGGCACFALTMYDLHPKFVKMQRTIDQQAETIVVEREWLKEGVARIQLFCYERRSIESSKVSHDLMEAWAKETDDSLLVNKVMEEKS